MYGYEVKIGFEVEYTVMNKNGLTLPEKNSYSSLNSLMNWSQDIENIYDMLEEAGIEVEVVHCESAESQMEIVLKYGDPFTSIDNLYFTKMLLTYYYE